MAFSLWKGAMKNAILALLMVVIVMTLSGCGETVSGVGKDVNRMGKGISTFFFRQ
jgi:predicted small secreted protein